MRVAFIALPYGQAQPRRVVVPVGVALSAARILIDRLDSGLPRNDVQDESFLAGVYRDAIRMLFLQYHQRDTTV